MVAFYEIEVWILHFFQIGLCGVSHAPPPGGGTPRGGWFRGRSRRIRGLKVLISCRINELRVRYPQSGQLDIMGIIRTDIDNPIQINNLRVV